METKKFVLKYDFPCTVQGSMPDFMHIDRGICMMVKNYLNHTVSYNYPLFVLPIPFTVTV